MATLRPHATIQTRPGSRKSKNAKASSRPGYVDEHNQTYLPPIGGEIAWKKKMEKLGHTFEE